MLHVRVVSPATLTGQLADRLGAAPPGGGGRGGRGPPGEGGARGGRRAAASSTAGVSRSRRSRMNSPRKPSVLFVFYTHTRQSLRVADAMADVLRERGCDVSLAGIEFTDPRYAGKFDRFPFRHAV